MLPTLTPEQQQAQLIMMQQAKADKVAQRKANEHKYKLEYLDSTYWQELAHKHKVRMPVYNEPASAGGIRKYLKKAKLTPQQWEDAYGKPTTWVINNPTYTLYAAVGHMLELLV